MSGMIGSAKIPANRRHGDDIQYMEPKRCSPRLLSNEMACGMATHDVFDTRNQEYSDDLFRLLIRKAANMSSNEDDTRKPKTSLALGGQLFRNPPNTVFPRINTDSR